MAATFANVENFEFVDYNADTETVTVRLHGPVLRVANLEPLRRCLQDIISHGNRVAHLRVEPGQLLD